MNAHKRWKIIILKQTDCVKWKCHTHEKFKEWNEKCREEEESREMYSPLLH